MIGCCSRRRTAQRLPVAGRARRADGRRRSVAHAVGQRRPVPLGARREAGGVRRLEGVAVRQRHGEPVDQRRGRRVPRRAAAARAGRAARGRVRRRQEGAQRRLPQAADAAVAGRLVHGRRRVHRALQGRAGAHRGWQRSDRDLCRGDVADTPDAAARLPRRHVGHRGDARSSGARGKAVLQFPTAETAKFHALVAPFVHPSMEYKLLPQVPRAVRGRAGVRRAASGADADARSRASRSSRRRAACTASTSRSAAPTTTSSTA